MCTDFCEFDVNDSGQNLSAAFMGGSPQGSVPVKLSWREGSVDENIKNGVYPMQLNFLKLIRQPLIRIGQVVSVVIIAFLIVPVTTWASGIGQRDIFVGASARVVGMGSAWTAGPAATNGFLWNPSSLGFMDGVEVNMGGMPFSGSPSGLEQAFSVAANPHTFGLTNKNVGNLSFATWLDGWKGDTTESTQIVLLGYGLALGQSASAGANLRYYQNNTPIRTNFLWSVDLGMQFAYPLEKWGDSVTVGVNLSELSNGIRADGVLLESIPLAARLGTTYQLGSATLFSADLAVRGENRGDWGERFRLHLGAERWLIGGHVGLRVGYTALTASERFWGGEWARGLSFRNSSGQLDYAYVSGSELEQSVHWISATLRWGATDAPLSEPVLTETSEADEHVPILMPATLTIHKNAPETSIRELHVSEWAISPNKDGFADSTTFHFEVGSNDKWWLILVDEYTERIWERSGSGSPVEGVTWDGIGNTGNLVPDGDYKVELYVSDAQGTLQFRDSEKVTVDLIPTALELFRGAATTNPQGMRVWHSLGIKTVDTNPLAHWKLKIFDARNVLIEEMEAAGMPPAKVVLNNLQRKPLAPYTCELSVQDIAGNQSTQRVQLHLGMEQGATSLSKPRWTLMVGSFIERRYAERMEAQLRNQNPSHKVAIYTATVDGKTRHRVTIGEFTHHEEAADLQRHIQEMLDVEPVLITVQ